MAKINTSKPEGDARRFPNDLCKWIFLNEVNSIFTQISLM